jgi:P27 family predicted phage terminase small subunit
MGLRGPAPKATALRVLEGNPGKVRLNDAEPQPDGKAKPPAWLSKRARREWRSLAPTLEACGLLTAADAVPFATLCDAIVNLADSTELVAAQGGVIEDEHGRRINPALRAQRNYTEVVLKLSQRFGLTPSDRTGIKVPKPKESKWSGML